MKNWSYTIEEGEHIGERLWSGRYVALCAIVLRKIDDLVFVLANRRGIGSPSYQGYWNLPGGYLDGDETGEEGIVREVYEECGIRILCPENLQFHDVETDPAKLTNNIVSIRYVYDATNDYEGMIDDIDFENYDTGGEDDEVSNRAWICIDDIDNYEWAFGHDNLIWDIVKNM